jgi:putative ABC transport system permease protein
MLGIIIGISSVIAITSIGASAKGAVSDEFESFGKAYMYLMVDYNMLAEQGSDSEADAEDLFSKEDVDALKERFSEDILYAVPFVNRNLSARVGRTKAEISCTGVDDNFESYNKTINVIYGRMINESDVKGGRDRIVIDNKCALKLFGREDAVGELVPVTLDNESRDFAVVGVIALEEGLSSQITAAIGIDSYTGYVPYTSLLSGNEVASFIEIYGNPDKDVKAQGAAYAKYIARVKDKSEDFYIHESAEGQQNVINQVLGVLSIAIGAIAAISLLVGGIGIMNIMLVSVTERTREIGIRKSLGARTHDILSQFLIEAVILSVIGGIIGTILGIGIAALGMSLANVDVVIQPLIILLAVVFSAGVGLFFGLFPARRAAKLDPIEALRYE